jgi:hypothetical protein
MDRFVTHGLLFGLGVAVLAYTYIKFSWRLKRSIDPALTTMRPTPTGYPVATAYRKKYELAVASGRARAAKSTLLIVSMVRDVASEVPSIIEKVEAMGGLFRDYRVLIVENDSVDGTRKRLLRWATQNPKVDVLGCGINVEECHLPRAAKTQKHAIAYDRISKMARIRNIYLDAIKSRYARGWDFAVMWDLDAISATFEDGVYHALGIMDRHPDVGVVCSNGIYELGAFSWFYDTYAIAEKHDPYSSDLHETYNFRKAFVDFRYPRGHPKIEVESCFSGLAIYRVSDLVAPGVTYPKPDENNVVCEHTLMHATLKARKVVDPSFINLMYHNP